MKNQRASFLVFWFMLIGGCVSGPNPKYTDENIDKDPRIVRVKLATSKHIYLPKCVEGQNAPCADLAIKHFDAYKTNVQKYCGGRKGKKCTKTLSDMLAAQMQLRYDGANWQQVDLVCTANPDKCEDMSDYEGMLAESHNRHYIDLMRTELNRIYKEMGQELQAERQALQERNGRFARALGELGSDLQKSAAEDQQRNMLRKPTTCTTSRRDALGNIQTVCD